MVTYNNSIERVRSVIKKYKKEITIEAILEQTSPYSDKPHYFIVTSRDPEYVYERIGNLLLGYDSGFYDTLVIEPGSTGAFGGRKFDIKLTDGTVYHAHGQVWSSGQGEIPEPYISVGAASVESLRKCYVFCSGCISLKKFEEAVARVGIRKEKDAYREFEKEIKCHP